MYLVNRIDVNVTGKTTTLAQLLELVSTCRNKVNG
nr:MAG TPA: Thymidylate kinase [Caudoviricetes sp.]